MEIENYIVITCHEDDEIEKSVMNFVMLWYIPLWWVSISHIVSEYNDNYTVYAQAMIKYKSKEPDQNSVESPDTVSE